MENRHDGAAPAELYYDSACELCRAEMKKLGPMAGDALALRDIHSTPEDGDLPSRDALLRRLHYRDSEGRLLVGLEANVAAWQHTRFGGLWRVLLWPPLRWLADPAYDAWALWRYRRLYGETDPGA